MKQKYIGMNPFATIYNCCILFLVIGCYMFMKYKSTLLDYHKISDMHSAGFIQKMVCGKTSF